MVALRWFEKTRISHAKRQLIVYYCSLYTTALSKTSSYFEYPVKSVTEQLLRYSRSNAACPGSCERSRGCYLWEDCFHETQYFEHCVLADSTLPAFNHRGHQQRSIIALFISKVTDTTTGSLYLSIVLVLLSRVKPDTAQSIDITISSIIARQRHPS